MKKIFTLFAAVMVAAMAMAETITLLPTNFKASYGTDVTITVDEVNFVCSGMMYNSKGTPAGVVKQTFIQARKLSTGKTPTEPGELTNTTELENISSITVIAKELAEGKTFYMIFGQDTIDAATLTPAKVEIEYTGYENNTEKPGQKMNGSKYVFENPGTTNTFKFLNGESAVYFTSIEITYGTEPTAIENSEVEVKAVKIVRNGQVIIVREGVEYDLMGARM